MRLKGVNRSETARHFGVRPESTYDWTKYGRIAKKHLPELFNYFADVAGPEFWGMPPSQSTGLDLDTLQIALVAVRKAIEAAEVSIDLYSTAPLIALAYRERSTLPAKPTNAQLKEFDRRIIERLELGVSNGEWGEGRIAGTGKKGNSASKAQKAANRDR